MKFWSHEKFDAMTPEEQAEIRETCEEQAMGWQEKAPVPVQPCGNCGKSVNPAELAAKTPADQEGELAQMVGLG